MTVLSDNNRDDTTSTHQERRCRRPRSRAARHETIEDTFSQQFSQLINIARRGHEAGIDSPTVPHQQASYSSTPNRSQRWHASDDESDGLNYVDSLFGEIESNISFGDYGGESDASVDRPTTMGREIAIHLDSESYMNTDTDIDPMNAGMDWWDSDDQEDDEDDQSEESDFDEAVDTMQQHRQQWHNIAPSGLNEQESEDVWAWRTTESRVNMADLMEGTEGPEIRRHFIGNPGDYVDSRQFEMLLEQFAEDNNIGRGAPPAATSFIESLPSVVISTSHETNGGVMCPVCKDHMPIRTIAKQLPCMHLYHSSCILPWLSSRNTCPICRYELPTDDPEYERSKQATTNERGIHGVEHIHPLETVEEISDEPEVEGTFNTHGGISTMEETNTSEHAVHAAQQPNGARGHRRWLFLAAAPVVSLVSLALVLCFTNPSSNVRRQLFHRSQSTTTA
uniref:RING-type E3 ubiquitin transferase n=1 Tax=Arundo donax TaxID=35708 RepID=A0A0A9DJU3_ARUDO